MNEPTRIRAPELPDNLEWFNTGQPLTLASQRSANCHSTPAEYVVELEDCDGARMRIQLRGAPYPDLAMLTKVFLRSEG